MGEVWRATDVSLGRTVAVKVLRPALLTDPGFDARFRAEARMMAALAHPNVVNVYDYGRSELNSGGSVAFLVMAYVDGEPLSRRIADAGRLSVAETMSVVAQAADALHAAHMHGIVHRDVKPANLLVQPNGAVKLVDFGVARSPAVTQVTTANAILGTAMYMAPEQASGRPVSPATDIYALGTVAYHCLAGEPPFNGDGPLEIALRHVSDEPPPLPADIPPAAQVLVARALAKDPADRYPTAAAFAAAARAVRIAPGTISAGTVVGGTVVGGTVLGGTVVGGTVRSAVAMPMAGSARTGAAGTTVADPPTTPELPAQLSLTARRPRSGPRVAAVVGAAGVVAAALIGLASLGGLVGSGRPAGSAPAERSERTGAPIAPAANPSTVAPRSSDQSGPAVPIRIGVTGSVPPPAPGPAGAGQAAPSGEPTATAAPGDTGGPSAEPSPSPTAATPTASAGPTDSAPPAGP
jgi:serine/threonine-protein kinase